jgi:thiamine pyrophosphate-dependent acetolactate synthase large subunit-like protein
VPTGGQLLADALQDAGVDVVFGLPGVHNLAAWQALAGSSVRLVRVRHDQTAAHAADGYARATGRVGFALTTTGPGAARTLGAVGEAWASGSPLVLVASDIASTIRRPGIYRGALHETNDQAALFAPVTKARFVVTSAAEIQATLCVAMTTALAAPSRPVYVGIPTDLLTAEADALPVPFPVGDPSLAKPLDADLERAAALLLAAERPLIWAGGGALRSGAGPAVTALAERLAAPVLLTYSARGLLPPDHPCEVGLTPHVPAAGSLWDAADLVIAIGTDFDGTMTQNWAMTAPPRLVAVNVDAEEAMKAYPPDVALIGDAAETTAALADRLPTAPALIAVRADLDRRRAQAEAQLRADHPAELTFLETMSGALPDDAVVVADLGTPGDWWSAFGRVTAPRRLAYPVGWGTVGFGFPAALGAAVGAVGPTVALCDAAGFLLACGELATAAKERIRVTVVIVDDGADLGGPDLAALAAAFGVRADTVDGLGREFGGLLTAHLESDEPTVLVARSVLGPPPSAPARWYRRPTMVT